MTSRRPEIGLGDLVRAMEQLQPEEQAELDKIARCLGFKAGFFAVEIPDYRPTRGAGNPARRQQALFEPQSLPAFSPVAPPAPEPPVALPKEILPIKIEKLPNTIEPARASILPPEIQQETILELEASCPPPVPRNPLFSPQTARGILSAAVMRLVPSSDLDTPRLIQSLIRARPLRRLPHLPRASVSTGCQLLLDFSDALVPWWEDLRILIRQFQSLLGEEACPVYEFAGDPRDAVRWTEAIGEQVWHAVPNQPVVVATDFGLTQVPGGQPRPGLVTWREFAAQCQRQQVPLIALTPLQQEHCPRALGRLMAIIHWNPATRAVDVKRLIDHMMRQ